MAFNGTFPDFSIDSKFGNCASADITLLDLVPTFLPARAAVAASIEPVYDVSSPSLIQADASRPASPERLPHALRQGLPCHQAESAADHYQFCDDFEFDGAILIKHFLHALDERPGGTGLGHHLHGRVLLSGQHRLSTNAAQRVDDCFVQTNGVGFRIKIRISLY